MAKPNYQFEKRQRELAKKKKKEEKLQQRRNGAAAPEADQEGVEGESATAESGEDTDAAPPATEASA